MAVFIADIGCHNAPVTRWASNRCTAQRGKVGQDKLDLTKVPGTFQEFKKLLSRMPALSGVELSFYSESTSVPVSTDETCQYPVLCILCAREQRQNIVLLCQQAFVQTANGKGLGRYILCMWPQEQERLLRLHRMKSDVASERLQY